MRELEGNMVQARTADGRGRQHLARRLAAGSGLLLCGALAAAGCGGGDAGAGAGKHDGCAAGETRTCVGPGACPGGQLCSAEGTWGTCDCGGLDAGDGGPRPDGSAQGDSAGLADATSRWKDDPCPPAGSTVLDCTGECAAAPAGSVCAELEACSQGLSTFLGPVVATHIRLHPWGPACTCDGYAHRLVYGLFAGATVHVDPPWHLQVLDTLTPECSRGPYAQCVEARYADAIHVVTEEPDPPVRNLFLDPGGACPTDGGTP